MEVQQQQPGAPSVIRIKRKRDDAPLDSLYLESISKRRATDHTYVFKRLETERRVESIFRQEYDEDGIPKVRATAEGEEKRDPYALGRVRDTMKKGEDSKKAEPDATPRRFHLSRAVGAAAATKGKSDVATFIERRQSPEEGIQATGATGKQEAPDSHERPLKRPTVRSRAVGQGSGTATPKSPSYVDVSLAEKMNQWSQETSQQEKAAQGDGRAATTTLGVDAMDVDNEAEYVYDTYYRQAVTESTMVPAKGISFGHLIIDEDQEDLWETYLDGNESDDREFETDDEDSNAEDYYGADYPEDEVASDDEYDRDLYQYRKNADDLEEFSIHERDTYEIDDGNLVRSDGEDDIGDDNLEDARAWRREFGKSVRGEDMVL